MDHVDGWNVNFDIFEYSPITAARVYGDAVLKDIDTHINEGVHESPDTPVRIHGSDEFHGKLRANGKSDYFLEWLNIQVFLTSSLLTFRQRWAASGELKMDGIDPS